MATRFYKPSGLGRYIKTCVTNQQQEQRCTLSVAFDINRLFIHYTSNSPGKRSLNLGLKNIMIYVISFLVMAGKRHKQFYITK